MSGKGGIACSDGIACGDDCAADRVIQASAVAVGGEGALITGPSGSGKSLLMLQIIGMGGILISDDQVRLRRHGAEVLAEAPAAIAGRIEARGVGILRCAYQAAPIRLVVDLGRAETERLPPIRHSRVMNLQRPLVLGPVSDHLAPAICLLLRGGRIDPERDLTPVSR